MKVLALVSSYRKRGNTARIVQMVEGHEEQGWFDPDCTFYIEHHANRLKVALARLTGAVLARFVA